MEILAFTTENVRKLTELSTRQIRYWDETGFFSPTRAHDEGGRVFGRIYTFRDVVGLRTIAILRKQYKLPLQELRKVGEWLSQRHDAPWATLKFALAGRHVAYFDVGTNTFVKARDGQQAVIEVTLEKIASATAKAASRLTERGKEDLGKIVRNRYVVHNAWVIAGTRIPVQAVKGLHAAGYSVTAIVTEYPRLTSEDVKAAIRYLPPKRRAA